MQLEQRHEVHVKIGEVKVGQSPVLLKATLGSCVGIGFLWQAKGIFGLAHCLLPDSPLPLGDLGAKYISHAVPSLMSMMNVGRDDIEKIRVVVAGGGNMMAQLGLSSSDQIGSKNGSAALRILDSYGFNIVHTDLGGDEGRQLIVDCTDGTYSVLKLQKYEAIK